MRSLLLTLLFLFVAPHAFAQSGAPHPDWSPETVVAFENVNVIPMDEERVVPGRTVLVRDGRIVEMGEASDVEVPAGALRIDGTGKYLLPGLAEMHGHIPGPDMAQHDKENILFLFVANGVTTVRGMQGSEGQLELRERAARGEIVAPTLYLAGPGFHGGSINSPEQARQRVRDQVAEGWDLLKVLPGLTREEYDAMAETAHIQGIRFSGHVPSDVGLRHAIERGQDTFDHIDGYVDYLNADEGEIEGEELEEIIRLSREADVAIVPTMAVWENLMGTVELDRLRGYDELKYLPASIRNNWIRAKEEQRANPNFDLAAMQRLIASRNAILRALHEGGVTMLFGTDAPQQFSVPGFSFHQEYLRMLDAGFTPYEILQSATANVGEYFRGWDSFGTVAVGKRADLILVNANPLENIHNIHQIAGVMARGRWLPKDRIDARLGRIAAAYAE